MKYEIRCESCGGSFTLEGIEAGQILNCPHCQLRMLYRHYEHLLPWRLDPEKKHPLEE